MPKAKLNPLTIAKLPAIGGRRTDYRDEVQPGLILRVTPQGARTWAVEYKAGRKSRKYRIGPLKDHDLGDARALARQIRARVDLGADPQLERNDARRTVAGITVGKLIEKFLRAVNKPTGPKMRETTLVEWRRLFKVEIPEHLLQTPAAAVGRGDLKAWRRPIAERAMSTAVHAHQALGRVFSWALDEELLQASPFAGLKPPGSHGTSNRVLSPEELRQLLRALEDFKKRRHPTAVLLLLLTMTRKSAVLGAARSEREGTDDEPLWVVPPIRSKRRAAGKAADRPHVVPLSSWANRLFDERLAAVGPRGELLFPPKGRGPRAGKRSKAPWGSLPSAFRVQLIKAVNIRHAAAALGLDLDAPDPLLAKAARLQAEAALKAEKVKPLPRWTIHNLRHTAATQLREQLGVTRDVVSLLLGHTAPGATVTGIYDRAELLPERRNALVAWAAWLDQLWATQASPGARVLPMRAGSPRGRPE